MARGILWVTSYIEAKDKITPEKFCDWYENTHVQEVLPLPGFPSAVRGELVSPTSTTTSSEHPTWLTIYNMHDVSYKDSPAYQAISQQLPAQELIDNIYAHASFDIRFYEEISCLENRDAGSEPTRFLVSTEHLDGGEDMVEGGQKQAGWLRTRTYKFVSGQLIKCFQFEECKAPQFLAVHEFGEGASVGSEAQPVYGVKRVYAESEWGGIGAEQQQA